MASNNNELDRFVRDALLAGQQRPAIIAALEQAGWTREQLAGVLDDYADVPFPVPVPRPRASLSARDAFSYLVLFSLLYFLCYHLGSLLFDLVNAAFPDPADRWNAFDFAGSTRLSTAALIIAFPLFAWVANALGKEIERAPVKRFSPVRRWLTYLTLFVSAITLVGDLTALVYHLLGGEITLRFVLKALIVGVIAGSVFGYYLWDLRRDESQTRSWNAWGKRLLIAAGALALWALAGGFALIGSPGHQRDLRIDERRLSDLRDLEEIVRAQYRQTGKLPESLREWLSQPGRDAPVSDPLTHQPYEYAVLAPDRFRLCATFSTDSAAKRHGRRQAPPWAASEWAHGVGRTCFDRQIDTSQGRRASVDAAMVPAESDAMQAPAAPAP